MFRDDFLSSRYAISLRGTNRDVSRRRDNYVYWSVHERYKPRERTAKGCFPRFYHARTTARIYIYRGAFKRAPRTRCGRSVAPEVTATFIFSAAATVFSPDPTIVYNDVTRATGENVSACDIGFGSNRAMHSDESNIRRSNLGTYSKSNSKFEINLID